MLQEFDVRGALMSALSCCPPLAKQMSEGDIDNIILGMSMRATVRKALCMNASICIKRVICPKQTIRLSCS